MTAEFGLQNLSSAAATISTYGAGLTQSKGCTLVWSEIISFSYGTHFAHIQNTAGRTTASWLATETCHALYLIQRILLDCMPSSYESLLFLFCLWEM